MRVLVTGGTGFLGSNVVKLYSEHHGADVIATGRRPPELSLPGRFEQLELEDYQAVRSRILAEQPDVLVHTAILNDFETMYADRGLAWNVYVESTRTIIDAANEVDGMVVFVSSDWVFDGTQPGADESTPPNPINYYGVLKLAGEIVTLERARHPLVARVAGVNGMHWARAERTRDQDAGFGHFVSALVDALQAGKPFVVWEGEDISERATPSLASESAEMIMRLVESGRRGIFHCCGGESVTRMELARAAVDAFGLDPSLVRAGRPELDASISGPVPRDTSLDARRTAKAIGYSLPSIRSLLETLREQRDTGGVAPVPA